VDDLAALEDRHRSVSFEELRRDVLAEGAGAWRRFVEKYSRFVYTVALKFLADRPDDREERAQEIYCRVFERLRRDRARALREFRGNCRFSTYLFRVVQSARADVLRRDIRDRERLDCVDFADEANRGLEAASPAARTAEPIPGVSPERLRAELARILDGLSPRDTLILKLRFQKGLKLRELGDLLGYRDTNAAAYALRKALRRFEPLAAVGDGGLSEGDRARVLAVLDEVVFHGFATSGGERGKPPGTESKERGPIVP
jgi:RNA polymerase sigma factor (sigma-70 family)